MRWSLRWKLIVGFLFFGLLPVLATTAVTFETIAQLEERKENVVRRSTQFVVVALDRSPLDDLQHGPWPLNIDVENLPVGALRSVFDRVARDFDLRTARIALIGPDLKVLVARLPNDRLTEGHRLDPAYVEQIAPLTALAGDGPPRPGSGVVHVDGPNGREVVGYTTAIFHEAKGSEQAFTVLAILSHEATMAEIHFVQRIMMLVSLSSLALIAVLFAFLGRRMVRILQQIGTASSSLSATSCQMRARSDGLSRDSTDQASAIQEIASSLQAVDTNIQRTAEHARLTATSAADLRGLAEQGGAAVNETVVAMRKIGQTIKVVEDIAYQTNLLALNAAIEAARAGVQGKGFAVVASEVRKLAERSQVAAKQIDDLTRSCLDVAEDAGQRIGGIVPRMRETASHIQEIAAASQEQKLATHQISIGVRQIEEVVQRNATASVELSTTATTVAEQATLLDAMLSRIDPGLSTAPPRASTATFAAPPAAMPATMRTHPHPGAEPMESTVPVARPRPVMPSSRALSAPPNAAPPGGVIVDLDTDHDFDRF